MDTPDESAERFEARRSHLWAIAYRMLGSSSEAEDAVQETWLRFTGADTTGVQNLGGWLTTVLSRVCLNILRTRRRRREAAWEPAGEAGPAGARPVADAPAESARAAGTPAAGEMEPDEEAVHVESVGRALLVVLDRLGPDERLAFVLHDLFAVPFDEIAPIVERTPATTKKLASRARQRVHGAGTERSVAGPTPGDAVDLARQRQVVDAFLTASRHGDLDGLLAVLAPDVVRRADAAALTAGVPTERRGARAVAEETVANMRRAQHAALLLVDGAVGAVVAPGGRLLLVLRPVVEDDRIAGIDVIADPARLERIDLALLDPVAPGDDTITLPE